MKRGSKEAQTAQLIWIVIAAAWQWGMNEPLGAAVGVTIALVFWFLEVVCRSIEWTAQGRSCGNVEIHTTGGGGSGGRFRPQGRTHSGE